MGPSEPRSAARTRRCATSTRTPSRASPFRTCSGRTSRTAPVLASGPREAIRAAVRGAAARGRGPAAVRAEPPAGRERRLVGGGKKVQSPAVRLWFDYAIHRPGPLSWGGTGWQLSTGEAAASAIHSATRSGSLILGWMSISPSRCRCSSCSCRDNFLSSQRHAERRRNVLCFFD